MKMNRLTYEIYNGILYLTDYHGDETEECEIYVKECPNAGFSIGTESFKLKDGVGRVKLSAIKKGEYIPKLILNEETLSGGALEVGDATVRLFPVCDTTQREARELQLLKRLDSAEREISALKDSVYGTTIF